MLDLPNSLGISLTFNVRDLTLHRGTFEPPCLAFRVSINTHVPRLPLLLQLHTNIEAVMDDEIMSSCDGF